MSLTPSSFVSDAVSVGSTLFSMFYGTSLTQLGLLQLDVLLTENLSFPSEVTKYPIEDGSEISDHITEGSEELNITGAISNAIDWSLQIGSCKSKLIDSVDTLRKMHKERKVVKIVTGLGTYDDMGFTALSFNRGAEDKGGNWITINASLRKIKKVQLKQADLPPDNAGDGSDAKGKTGGTEKHTGTNTDKPPDGPRKSWGYQTLEKYKPSALGPLK